ncbi:MAG: hypothetical protein NT069_19430, partial [Planctomycetota bacterium]|nr:hypothetical protein [Planctomycetota bacterium]
AGPFANQQGSESASVESISSEPADSTATETVDDKPVTPLTQWLEGLAKRMPDARDDTAKEREIALELLALTPDQITAPYDAGWAMHLMQFLLEAQIPARDIWNWAEAISSRHLTDARVLNALATLAFRVTELDEELKTLCDDQRIAGFFQQSLDLDPTLPRNFARAGAYYLFRERLDDAERCFSRAFRLDRTNGVVATQLAELYENGDRGRDALAVLDLALREGCDDPQVAWQAALLAFRHEQYAALLTYLDRFEAQSPGEPWVNYYRAVALLEQNQPDDAIAAVEEELRRSPEQRLHVEILEACALAAKQDLVEFRSQLRAILRCRPAEATYLTHSGFFSLYHRLWRAAGCLPVDDSLRQELETRLLQTGLAPDDFIGTSGTRGGEVENVDFFQVLANQPVASDWKVSFRCLPGQESWTEYRILWGVLARDEEEATRLVLAIQDRCEGIPASVLMCIPSGDSYKEVPRVVWQGERSAPEPESESPPEGDDLSE